MDHTTRTNGHVPHILNTSANLFGICAVLITGLRITGTHIASLADEVLLATSFALLSSCMLSYFSIRFSGGAQSMRLERAADYVFLGAMFGMFCSLVLTTAVVL